MPVAGPPHVTHKKSSKGENSSLLMSEEGQSNRMSSSGDDYLNEFIEKGSKHVNKYAIALAIGNAADAVEILCVGYIMSEMDDDTSTSDKELLSSAVFIGMLAGGLLCGIMSDRIGRKPCLQFSLFLNAIAGAASAVAPDINWLIAIRVVGGIGIGGSVPSVFTLGAEIFPSLIRGKMLSFIARFMIFFLACCQLLIVVLLPCDSFWMVGAIYTALAGWLMLGKDLNGNRMMPGITWRAFAVVCTLPAVLALVLSYTVLPESPRFLAGKKKYVEAVICYLYLIKMICILIYV
jgi:MFS transporter, putative metabolite:H+ symporter